MTNSLRHARDTAGVQSDKKSLNAIYSTFYTQVNQVDRSSILVKATPSVITITEHDDEDDDEGRNVVM